MCHFSEVPGWTGRKSDPPPLTPGQEADFKVIRMSEGERKIGLSLKAMADSQEHDRLEDYRRRATAGSGLEAFAAAQRRSPGGLANIRPLRWRIMLYERVCGVDPGSLRRAKG